MRRSTTYLLLTAAAATILFLLLRKDGSPRIPKEPEDVLACLGQAGFDMSLPKFEVKDYRETSAYDDCLWLEFVEPFTEQFFYTLDSLCSHSASGWRLRWEHPRHHDGTSPAGRVYEYVNPDAQGMFETIRFYPDSDHAMMTIKHLAK